MIAGSACSPLPMPNRKAATTCRPRDDGEERRRGLEDFRSQGCRVGAPWASHLIVTARTAGARRDTKGIGVFIVAKDAKGVTTRDYPTVDGRRASEVHFDNVSVGADAVIGDAEGGACR
jgi:hypothetical protein